MSSIDLTWLEFTWLVLRGERELEIILSSEWCDADDADDAAAADDDNRALWVQGPLGPKKVLTFTLNSFHKYGI